MASSPTGRDSDVLVDHLDAKKNTAFMKNVKKLNGGLEETVLFSIKLTKFNKRDKAQQRAMVITDQAIYNLAPEDNAKIKRRIDLQKIGSLTSSQASDEFVIHVPDEYDYRFDSAQKDLILKALKRAYKHKTGNALKTVYIGDEELGKVTWTKAKGKSREEIIKLKQTLALEKHDSDNEENKVDEKITELINNSKDKKSISADDFELLKVLGRGSFGKVMQVRKKDTGVIYAMKILKKSQLVVRDQVEHTKAERQILEAMQHPFLMGLRYAFQTPTKLYLVMDFYKGGELFFHLKNRRRFNEDEARLMMAEISLALNHVHKLNFIYRDLKPENILMDDDGHACLTDFGLSKDVDPNKGEFGTTFCGTPEYLAPEVIRGGIHGKAVDWWSLGTLLFEVVVGAPPFYSQNTNEMYQKIMYAPLKFPRGVSQEFVSLVTMFLERDPEKRLGSGEESDGHGFLGIRNHPWFKPLDFDKVMRKEYSPVYKPTVNSGTDTSNFDPEFTAEPVVESLVPDSELATANKANFDSFTYVSSDQNSHLR